ncbi:DUF4249 family protein [Flavobacteriaceae bacterium TP-CH-4]|uniref:DUF4249 family protein n=1 Tax=Pelagihabitans pacificus TaxID=2696054 RepID=A0A967AS35_9FLAO|nr:DUF4249 family protein [Pelagihabitans pacificus]NHF59339.1 DUF4249 family protein [Pelagihabitans pacificus]
MRYFILILCLLFCFYGCEDVIEPELSETLRNIVIDGQIHTFYGDESGITRVFVQIQYSNPYFVENIDYVNDADIILVNLNTNDTLLFDSKNVSNGLYRLKQPLADFDKMASYELTVLHKNQIFRATNHWQRTVSIDTIVNLGPIALDEFDRAELKVYFTDLSDRKDYYLATVTSYEEPLLFDDRFFNGNQFSFSIYPVRKNSSKDTLSGAVILQGVDPSYFTYWDILLELGNPAISGPFATPRPNSYGNFINVSDKTNPPFGYFAISEIDRYTFNFQ